MTGPGGACTFAIRDVEEGSRRKSDFPAESRVDGEWHCPRDAVDGADRCIFHLPADEKDDVAVAAALRDAIRGDEVDPGDEPAERRRREFFGAEFGDLEWPAETLLDGADLEEPIYLSHVEFRGDVDFGGVRFDADVRFTGSTFAEGATFSHATFEGDVRFNGVTFRGDAALDHTVFEREVRSGDVTFEGVADFYRATFEEDMNIKYADFHGWADFWKATIEDTIRFNDAVFHPLENEKDESEGKKDGREDESDEGVEDIESEETDEDEDDEEEFHRLIELDLSNANFTDATLRDVNLEASELNKAKLFGADLRGCRLHGAVLTDSRIDDQTRFLGAPGGQELTVSSLLRFWSKPRCVYDPRYPGRSVGEDTKTQRNKAKSTYRAIEEVAGAASRPQLQSLCFVNRQDIHRRTHHDDLIRGPPTADADGAGEPPSVRERGAARVRSALYRAVKLFQWLRAELARWTLLYGESPWRIIATGLMIVVGFAFLYPIGGLTANDGTLVTYATIVENPRLLFDSVYFSTLTFTTLGMGDYQPVGSARVLTTIQTALGAILIALLVFVFGRRAAR